MASKEKNQSGASAVEFAIILPILMTLLLGIIEFSYLFNQQISLTQAAREGAREYALHQGTTGFDLDATVQNAAPGLETVTASSVPSTGCPSGTSVIITVSHSYSSLTGWFDFLNITTAGGTKAIVLEGQGAMRCGG